MNPVQASDLRKAIRAGDREYIHAGNWGFGPLDGDEAFNGMDKLDRALDSWRDLYGAVMKRPISSIEMDYLLTFPHLSGFAHESSGQYNKVGAIKAIAAAMERLSVGKGVSAKLAEELFNKATTHGAATLKRIERKLNSEEVFACAYLLKAMGQPIVASPKLRTALSELLDDAASWRESDQPKRIKALKEAASFMGIRE